jgi:hypothetical protein
MALALTCLGGSLPAAEDASFEYKLKAGFLFNFAKFVQWPSKVLPAADSPITIGVFEDDPAAPVLQEVLAGDKRANGRPVTVKLLHTNSPPQGCHILFLGRSKKGASAEVLAQTRAEPILTVGEADHFAEHGGIINFVRKDESFRFEVNLQLAEQVGLKVSAKLASLATIVKSPQ